MASSDAQASGVEKAAQFRDIGADAFVLLLTRMQAESAGTAARLNGVTGIWFTGGDQTLVTPVLLGTATLAAMKARYRAGAVVGGTSAGAAVMSDSMLTGNQRPPGDTLGYYGDEFPVLARGVIEVVPGLGFFPGVIVDQHFVRRERHNRLLAVTLNRHRHEKAVEPYNHENLGFNPGQLRKLCAGAGLEALHCEAEITERRPPYFSVVTLLARKGQAND